MVFHKIILGSYICLFLSLFVWWSLLWSLSLMTPLLGFPRDFYSTIFSAFNVFKFLMFLCTIYIFTSRDKKSRWVRYQTTWLLNWRLSCCEQPSGLHLQMVIVQTLDLSYNTLEVSLFLTIVVPERKKFHRSLDLVIVLNSERRAGTLFLASVYRVLVRTFWFHEDLLWNRGKKKFCKGTQS